MKIETKFNVNDLVLRKFDTKVDMTIPALEIMEVIIQICYAGAQIFYLCRAVVAKQEKEGYGKDATTHWVVFHGVGKDDNTTGWRKYREDELVIADEETTNLILNTNKGEYKTGLEK